MREQRSGRIINITSPGSRMALPDYTAYTASRAVSRACVVMAPYGVLVNSLAPGMMDTEMQRSTEVVLAKLAGRETTCRPSSTNAPAACRSAVAPKSPRSESPFVWLCLDASIPHRRTLQHLRRPRQRLIGINRNSPPAEADIAALKARATSLRRHMLTMARGQGQGYIGQGLGIADTLAALYFHELRYDPQNLHCKDRDRFLLSTGHYSIALWAALTEAAASFPWTNSQPTAPTTAGSKCRRSTPRPASRSSAARSVTVWGRASARASASTTPMRASLSNCPMARCRRLHLAVCLRAHRAHGLTVALIIARDPRPRPGCHMEPVA